DVFRVGRHKSILTIEIESVNSEALHALADDGVEVHPHPEALDVIKDKSLQKQFYSGHGLPTSRFETFESLADVREAIARHDLDFPFVIKARRDGYDGR